MRPDTNYLNFTNGTHTPLYGLSGKISTVIDENASPKVSQPISMYQYAVLGCRRSHDADGTGTRETATDFVENCSLVIKASTCVDGGGYPSAGAISIDKTTNHAPECAVGFTPRTAGAVVDIDLSTDPFKIVDVQYYGDTTAMNLNHDVLVPGVGVDNEVDFDEMWAAIDSNNTLDNFPVDLDRVFFRNDGFSAAHTYVQTVLGLDTTDEEVPEAVSIVLDFKGAIETRSVYPTLDNAATDHTLSTHSNIKVYDGMGNSIESRVYLVYPRASQLVAEATNPEGFVEYTNTGVGGNSPEGAPLPTEDNTYVLVYGPNKIYDYYNHTDSALPTFVTFKVGDGFTTTANNNTNNTGNCTNNSVVNVTGSGNTINGTADTSCDDELFLFDGSSDTNTVNAGTGDDTGTMEGTDNYFYGDAGDDYSTFGGMETEYHGGAGEDVFEVGYEMDYPKLLVTDMGSCSALKFEIYDGDPTQASKYSESESAQKAYANMTDAEKEEYKKSMSNGSDGSAVNIREFVYNDVEWIVYKNNRLSFAEACANATGSSATLYVDVDNETETGTAVDEIFVITANGGTAIGNGGDDIFQWIAGSDTCLVYGGDGTDVMEFPGKSTEYYRVDQGGGDSAIYSNDGLTKMFVDSYVEYYRFIGDGVTMDYATMVATLPSS